MLLPDLKKSFFSKIFCWDPNEITAFLYGEMAEKNTFECRKFRKVLPPKTFTCLDCLCQVDDGIHSSTHDDSSAGNDNRVLHKEE